MTDAAFDTLKFTRKLRDRANLSQDAALRDFILQRTGTPRRGDLREMDLRLDARIDRLDARIEGLRPDILKWINGGAELQTLMTLGSVFAPARFHAH